MLPERWQRLVPEMTKFAAIGVINTVVDFAIYNALLRVGPIKASAAAMVVATTVSYVLNRYWTFAHRERSTAQREYTLFFALNFLGFLIQTAPVAFAKYGLGFDENGTVVDYVAFNLAKVIGIGFGMLFRFWSYRKYVFKAPKPAVPEATTAESETATAVAVTATAASVTPDTPATPAASTSDAVAETNGADLVPAQALADCGPGADRTDDEFAELLIDEAVYSGEPTHTAR
jgi:putative flippase GtrA